MSPLLRVKCPECGAGLKSSTGFAVGQAVTCPKCETEFAVEDPAEAPPPRKAAKAAVPDDEDDDRPRKKKRRRDEDDEPAEKEWSYKNSTLRYVVLGLLLVALGVLGFLFYKKKQDEAKDAAAPSAPPAHVA